MKRNRKIALFPTTTSTPANEAVARLVLNVPAFGSRYGVSRRTVWTWLKQGLPHMNFGPRKRKIPVAEADRWVAENFLRQRES